MTDVRTLMLMLAVGNIAFALLMVWYVHSGRGNAPLRLWRWAKLAQGMGHLLAWLQPFTASAEVGMLVGALLLGGALLDLAAYLCFLNVAHWRQRVIWLGGFGGCCYFGAWAAGARPSQQATVLLAVLALLALVMAAALLRRRGASALQRVMGCNDLLFACVLGTRVLALAFSPLGAGQLADLHGLVYLCAFVLMIVNGFGFLLLCKQQDDGELARLATVDPLTGLMNRRAFFERAQEVRTLVERTELPLSLLMLDIDHFKRINDQHGHGAGDEALRAFAALASGALREPDLLGRLGGEEFAVLMPAADLAGAIRAAERLRNAMAGALLEFDGQSCTLCVSIGVTLLVPAEPLHLALARADRALYEAKRAGRNCVRSCVPESALAAAALPPGCTLDALTTLGHASGPT